MATKRWYKGFYYSGDPRKLVNVISRQVQVHNLSKFIPILRIEKGARPGRPFCFFIAIESSDIGEIPAEMQSQLLQLSHFQNPIRGRGFTYDQIKSMVGIAHDVHVYTSNLPYQPKKASEEPNPFDFSRIQPDAPTENTELQSLKYERLLYWLSALGNGTWDGFKRACYTLQIEEPRRILRHLKLLGHLESSVCGSRWSIASTAIITPEVDPDLQGFIICGQRSVGLLQELGRSGDLNLTKQPRGNAPPRVSFRLSGSMNLSCFVEQVRSRFEIADAGRAAVQMAKILPDIVDWKKELESLAGVLPHNYEIKYFNGSEFIDYTFLNETGLYQFWNQDSAPYPHYTLFYDRASDRWLRGDWYGLRFLALHNLNLPLTARYNSTTSQLAIPFAQRWIELYERPLVLASGKLPTDNNGWLIYESISLQLAFQLTSKLHVSLKEESTYA